MKKGYIVRKSTKKVFVKSTATAEEIKFINDTYARLGWEVSPCKNEGKKPTKTKREVNETLKDITYDDIIKEELLEFAENYLTKEEYTEFIKASYTVRVDKNGKKKPSYHHIKAKDFIFKLKFAEAFKKIEDRRNKTKKVETEEEKKLNDTILSILEG